MLMLAYLFAPCSHAAGEFSLPAIAASLLSFLAFLSFLNFAKFRGGGFRRVFQKGNEGDDDDDETKYSPSIQIILFGREISWGGIFEFLKGREDETKFDEFFSRIYSCSFFSFFFYFLFLIAEGMSLEWKRRVFPLS